MPFPQQQGALELTETITKPNTSLCQGKASIKTLNLQLTFQHNQNTDIRAASSSLKLQKSLMKTLLMDIPLEVESPLHRAFKDTLGGLTLDLLAPKVKCSSESRVFMLIICQQNQDLVAQWLRESQFP